ncbi:hypothetical protein CBR_g21002 [Chara braunii]|uniref:U-box domain-containing protein n=1 Tax=Chara braunii TaxID=69332 RepID=A0A388L0C2_CHABU|nr:hypothetical protein CBR_g21002 [Chara braunii]|eukprot:GBG75757.1 hypothetical protein CBR_g21002 [Chara braunii]
MEEATSKSTAIVIVLFRHLYGLIDEIDALQKKVLIHGAACSFLNDCAKAQLNILEDIHASYPLRAICAGRKSLEGITANLRMAVYHVHQCGLVTQALGLVLSRKHNLQCMERVCRLWAKSLRGLIEEVVSTASNPTPRSHECGADAGHRASDCQELLGPPHVPSDLPERSKALYKALQKKSLKLDENDEMLMQVHPESEVDVGDGGTSPSYALGMVLADGSRSVTGEMIDLNKFFKEFENVEWFQGVISEVILKFTLDMDKHIDVGEQLHNLWEELEVAKALPNRDRAFLIGKVICKLLADELDVGFSPNEKGLQRDHDGRGLFCTKRVLSWQSQSAMQIAEELVSKDSTAVEHVDGVRITGEQQSVGSEINACGVGWHLLGQKTLREEAEVIDKVIQLVAAAIDIGLKSRGSSTPINIPSASSFASQKIPHPPDAFICPLTLKTIKHPVVLETGVSYEKEAITEHVRRYPTCPASKKELVNPDLMIPNTSLEGLIRKWEAHCSHVDMAVSASTGQSLPRLKKTWKCTDCDFCRCCPDPHIESQDGHLLSSRGHLWNSMEASTISKEHLFGSMIRVFLDTTVTLDVAQELQKAIVSLKKNSHAELDVGDSALKSTFQDSPSSSPRSDLRRSDPMLGMPSNQMVVADGEPGGLHEANTNCRTGLGDGGPASMVLEPGYHKNVAPECPERRAGSPVVCERLPHVQSLSSGTLTGTGGPVAALPQQLSCTDSDSKADDDNGFRRVGSETYPGECSAAVHGKSQQSDTKVSKSLPPSTAQPQPAGSSRSSMEIKTAESDQSLLRPPRLSVCPRDFADVEDQQQKLARTDSDSKEEDGNGCCRVDSGTHPGEFSAGVHGKSQQSDIKVSTPSSPSTAQPQPRGSTSSSMEMETAESDQSGLPLPRLLGSPSHSADLENQPIKASVGVEAQPNQGCLRQSVDREPSSRESSPSPLPHADQPTGIQDQPMQNCRRQSVHWPPADVERSGPPAPHPDEPPVLPGSGKQQPGRPIRSFTESERPSSDQVQFQQRHLSGFPCHSDDREDHETMPRPMLVTAAGVRERQSVHRPSSDMKSSPHSSSLSIQPSEVAPPGMQHQAWQQPERTSSPTRETDTTGRGQQWSLSPEYRRSTANSPIRETDTAGRGPPECPSLFSEVECQRTRPISKPFHGRPSRMESTPLSHSHGDQRPGGSSSGSVKHADQQPGRPTTRVRLGHSIEDEARAQMLTTDSMPDYPADSVSGGSDQSDDADDVPVADPVDSSMLGESSRGRDSIRRTSRSRTGHCFPVDDDGARGTDPRYSRERSACVIPSCDSGNLHGRRPSREDQESHLEQSPSQRMNGEGHESDGSSDVHQWGQTGRGHRQSNWHGQESRPQLSSPRSTSSCPERMAHMGQGWLDPQDEGIAQRPAKYRESGGSRSSHSRHHSLGAYDVDAGNYRESSDGGHRGWEVPPPSRSHLRPHSHDQLQQPDHDAAISRNRSVSRDGRETAWHSSGSSSDEREADDTASSGRKGRRRSFPLSKHDLYDSEEPGVNKGGPMATVCASPHEGVRQPSVTPFADMSEQGDGHYMGDKPEAQRQSSDSRKAASGEVRSPGARVANRVNVSSGKGEDLNSEQSSPQSLKEKVGLL